MRSNLNYSEYSRIVPGPLSGCKLPLGHRVFPNLVVCQIYFSCRSGFVSLILILSLPKSEPRPKAEPFSLPFSVLLSCCDMQAISWMFVFACSLFDYFLMIVWPSIPAYMIFDLWKVPFSPPIMSWFLGSLLLLLQQHKCSYIHTQHYIMCLNVDVWP